MRLYLANGQRALAVLVNDRRALRIKHDVASSNLTGSYDGNGVEHMVKRGSHW